MDVTVFCKLLMEVTSHHLCRIKLVRVKSLGQPNAKGGDYIRVWKLGGRAHWGPSQRLRTTTSKMLAGQDRMAGDHPDWGSFPNHSVARHRDCSILTYLMPHSPLLWYWQRSRKEYCSGHSAMGERTLAWLESRLCHLLATLLH